MNEPTIKSYDNSTKYMQRPIDKNLEPGGKIMKLQNIIKILFKICELKSTCTPMADSCQCMAKTTTIL